MKGTLRNPIGDKIDEVDYQSTFPWPIAANGDGVSMELINPDLDNDLAVDRQVHLGGHCRRDSGWRRRLDRHGRTE